MLGRIEPGTIPTLKKNPPPQTVDRQENNISSLHLPDIPDDLIANILNRLNPIELALMPLNKSLDKVIKTNNYLNNKLKIGIDNLNRDILDTFNNYNDIYKMKRPYSAILRTRRSTILREFAGLIKKGPDINRTIQFQVGKNHYVKDGMWLQCNSNSPLYNIKGNVLAMAIILELASVGIVEFLIRTGADVNQTITLNSGPFSNKKYTWTLSLLALAIWYNASTEIVEALINAGANINKAVTKKKEKYGCVSTTKNMTILSLAFTKNPIRNCVSPKTFIVLCKAVARFRERK